MYPNQSQQNTHNILKGLKKYKKVKYKPLLGSRSQEAGSRAFLEEAWPF